MKHHIFSQAESYPVAILLKPSAFGRMDVQRNYVDPLKTLGLKEDVIAVTLDQGAKAKPTAKEVKAYLETLLPELNSLGTTLLYVTDGTYFKALAKKTKAEPHAGYVLPCAIEGYTHMRVVLGLNHQQLIYDPALQGKMDRSLDAVVQAMNGTYVDPGLSIIHSAHYPKDYHSISQALDSLHQYPELAVDIEAFSLKFNEAGIGTITFCWDEHNGIAFPVDYFEIVPTPNNEFGEQIDNIPIKTLIRDFFESYKGKITFHHAAYDVKVIIYELWMKDLLDTEGLLRGLEVMTARLDDTKIIAYLAYNSTAGNALGLKALAHEFAGNYAMDNIKDIRRIRLADLLKYNLVDGLSTNYVKKRDYPIMVRDKQEDLYKGLMLDSLKLIIQLELTGMPMSRKKIMETKEKLLAIQQGHLDTINSGSIIQTFNHSLQVKTMELANSKLKTKQHPLEKFKDVVFNPNSGPQLQDLLYGQLGLPVIDYTDTKMPATGADTLDKLINHATDPAHKALLEALIGYGKVTKILSTFIPAFEGAISKDGSDTVWLHGSFNLGGAVSGRLSSSDPNMQNLPSGSEYGKLIKTCFVNPPGELFVGADFNALEDRVNTLLTKDPNKIKVFTEGYDSHCLRAFYFFPDKLPGIVDDVQSINAIKKQFPEIRQLAKAPAFALQYAGTWRTLVTTLGFQEQEAKQIEENFHKMYSVSGDWVKGKIAEAAKLGYSDTAFGLRIRTPMLKQVVWGSSKVPREAEAEARTLGNAISGQSYGLLNNRAAVAFMKKVWASKYRTQIKPVALIHDACYFIIKDDIEIVEWVNNHLTDEMSWQELPEIAHEEVKLGAELDIFYKGWHQPITLPNGISQEDIRKLCKEKAKSYDEKM